jgi:hypothetical protein
VTASAIAPRWPALKVVTSFVNRRSRADRFFLTLWMNIWITFGLHGGARPILQCAAPRSRYRLRPILPDRVWCAAPRSPLTAGLNFDDAAPASGRPITRRGKRRPWTPRDDVALVQPVKGTLDGPSAKARPSAERSGTVHDDAPSPRPYSKRVKHQKNRGRGHLPFVAYAVLGDHLLEQLEFGLFDTAERAFEPLPLHEPRGAESPNVRRSRARAVFRWTPWKAA